MSEDALLTGKLESTNEPYAIAKIAGIKLCESFNAQYGTRYTSVMPTTTHSVWGLPAPIHTRAAGPVMKVALTSV